jgi:hypothetical protein
MIYSIPAGGGAPTAISAAFPSGSGTFGGIFAPASFGALAGYYLSFGYAAVPAAVYSLSSPGGTPKLFYSDPNPTYSFDTPVVAPSGFGSVGGFILAPEAFESGSTSTVAAFSPSGTVKVFSTIGNFASEPGLTGGFGTAFTPAGFIPGTTGQVLLVSDTLSGQIDWIDAAGNAHLFATVPLEPGQTGLRQMAFAPAGFGQYGGDLFVSVSGSPGGGGTFGSVDVINSAGQLVGVITEGTVGAPFDPRGLYFESNNQLLIADSDPSIYSAPPAAVQTPEPGALLTTLAGLGIIGGRIRRRCVL